MGSETTIVGSILSIGRYPVKSMQGEEIDGVEVTERGVLGDRAYALVDICGHSLSIHHASREIKQERRST